MESINTLIELYTIQIIAAAALLSMLSLLFVVMNYVRTTKVLRRYRRLMRGADNINLEAMLHQHLDTMQDSMVGLKDIERVTDSLSKQLDGCVQRVGMVRYNAFEQMGGEQSFSVAFLDNQGNGMILTSLYGRSSSTTFGKPVQHHKSSYPLSNEEQEALAQASRQK